MMSLAEAARALEAPFAGADARFAGVSTDSRTLRAGDLFVALRGERFDGHAFLEAAAKAGVGVVGVSRIVVSGASSESVKQLCPGPV